MTEYPDNPLSAIGSEGAFEIGDGFKFGQDYSESMIQALFRIPTSNLENALELIREQLLKLPLDVLKIFKDFIPGTVDDDFIDTVTAAATIVDNLIAKPAITAILNLLQSIFELLTENALAQCLVAWFTDQAETTGEFLTDFVGGLMLLLEEINNGFINNPTLNALKDLVEDTGLLALNVFNGGAEALARLLTLIGFADISDALDFLQKLVNDVWELLTGNVAESAKNLENILEALFSWIARVPVIGTLVEYLTQGFPDIDFTPDLAGLSQWAERLLHTESKLPAQNLFGTIPGTVLSTIPVGSISNTSPNLLTQGAFGDISNLEAANGWTWDSAVNKTGTGGSAKLNCGTTSGTRQLYSNQNIPVTAGDRIGVSAFVNTLNFNGNSTSIQIGIVSFAGKVQKSTYLLASRGASNQAWGELTNRTSLWEVPKAAAASEQITSIQLTIAVASSATTGTVNWDDITLWKGGLMQQNLVDALLGAFSGLFDGLRGWPNGSTSLSGATTTNMFQAANAAQGLASGASTTAGQAVTNNQTVIDGIAQTVGSAGTVNNAPGTVKTNFQSFFQGLFGQFTPKPTLTTGAIPDLDGSKIKTGTVPLVVIPTNDIGKEINPAATSGAQISRRNTNNANAAVGTFKLAAGFYDFVDVNSNEIQVLTSSNQVVTGTGAAAGLAGIFRVLTPGWYMVEMCIKLNPSVSFGGRVAPVLYRSSSYPGTATSLYKVGADGVFAWWGFGGAGPRFAQSTFMVYLPAGGAVQAGFTGDGTGLNVFDADANGTETYFTISLINKTF